MKRIIKFFKGRADRRLRERCIQYAIKNQITGNLFKDAKAIFGWIKSGIIYWDKQSEQ